MTTTTTVAPEVLRAHLEGTHVTLWPYLRGAWPRETPYTLWQLVEHEGASARIFWMEPTPTPAGYTVVGDLFDFVRFVGDDRRLLLMAEAKGTGELAGLFWFDGIEPGHKASAGVLYRRKFWGAPAREASTLALRYGFAAWDLEAIYAFTPWEIARKHAQACGMQTIARLPRFIKIGDAVHDLMVCCVRREEAR